MNFKSLCILLAFLGWGWYSWSWLKDQQSACGCSLSTVTEQNATPPATTAENSLPLSFNWSSNQPIKGTGFDNYFKSQLDNRKNNDTLLIKTWYYETEDNGEQISLQRGDNIKNLVADSLKPFLKVTTEKRLLSDTGYKTHPFTAAEFEVLKVKNTTDR